MSDTPFENGCPEEYRYKSSQLRLATLEDGGAEIDRFFDALGDTRRRLILLHLHDHDSADLHQLADTIADHEEVNPTEKKLERIRIHLDHYQLPKLADHGLISYDTRTNEASLVPLPEAVEQILAFTQNIEGTDTQ